MFCDEMSVRDVLNKLKTWDSAENREIGSALERAMGAVNGFSTLGKMKEINGLLARANRAVGDKIAGTRNLLA